MTIIVGRSPILGPRVPASGSGGGCLDSARFQENPATSGHEPQEVGGSTITMRWSHVVFDDLGFPADWGHSPETGMFYFPTSGEYLIVCYIQVEPNEGEDFDGDPGNISVVFEATFVDPLDAWWEQVSGPITDPATRLSLSAVHRIDLNANPGAGFSVDVHSWNMIALGYVSRATISITRLCEGVASDEGGGPR